MALGASGGVDWAIESGHPADRLYAEAVLSRAYELRQQLHDDQAWHTASRIGELFSTDT